MEKSPFVPGDLVLVNLPVPKRPSQRRHGYWPAKITRKLQNCSRQVKCYATQEVCKVPIQSIVVYNKETIKAYLGIQADKDSVLAQALAEIKADFVAKSLSAEEIHLSRESKLVTSVVKNPRLLESIDVGSTLLNLWNSYVEKSIGKSWGMCHLSRFTEDFIKEHKEAILGEEIYRDFMFHVCSLEEVGLISSIEVKSIVESLTELNGRCIKDASSNNALDAKTDSTQPLLTECPDIIDVDIDSPIEITSESQSEYLGDGPSAKPKGCVEKKLVRRVRMTPVEQWLEIMENNGHNAVGINSTDPGGTLNSSSNQRFTLAKKARTNLGRVIRNNLDGNSSQTSNGEKVKENYPFDLEVVEMEDSNQASNGESDKANYGLDLEEIDMEDSEETSNGEMDEANYRLDLEVVEVKTEMKMSSASFARIGHLLPPGLAVRLR